LLQIFSSIYDFVRELRIKHGIKQNQLFSLNLITDDPINLLEINNILGPFNIKVNNISNKRIDKQATVVVIENLTIEYTADFIDPSAQLTKINSELKRLESEIQRSQKILSNKQFLAKAPQNKIDEEQRKYQEYQSQYQKNLTIYQNLKSKK
jgi:valyl-tRNA synthetase